MLIISGHEKGALTAITQIDALKVYLPILAMTHCDSAQIAEKLGAAAEYAFCAHQWHASLAYKDELFGSAGDFAKAFKAAYRYEAPYQAAQSAAAVHVYAEAFKRAQSLDPEKVRDAIAATELECFRPGQVRRGGPERRQAHGAEPGCSAANMWWSARPNGRLASRSSRVPPIAGND